MNEIHITTGDVTYALLNEFGEKIGQIRFNPNDLDLYKRAEEIEKFFSKKRVDTSKDDCYEECMKFSEEIKEKFNYLFNRNVSDDIFHVCNPLTVVGNGELYFIVALDACMDVIGKERQKANEALEARVAEAVKEITEE